MRSDARRNYERIVTTAREVFLTDGIHAPLDDVVKRAAIGAGTLYRHFPTREVLIEAVYRQEIEEIAARADTLAATLPPEAALHEWFRELITFHTERSDLATALKAAINENSETFHHCKSVLRAAAGALLEAAQAAGAIRTDLHPTDLMRLSHGIGTSAKYADEPGRARMLRVVLDGMRP